ncbi:MAG TPA: nitrilase-related carbon-nitrogen hydrolase, partial [Steroidobacteraceae bacterium]
MDATLRLALAQINLLVGDVQGNVARVVETARRAQAELAPDLVVFPELTLSGYPPEDLLFHRGFRRQVMEGLERLRHELPGIGVIVGYPEYHGKAIYNSAAVILDGVIAANHRKRELPNYKVFDEKRYFIPGTQPTVIERRGFRIGVLVCEDIWEPEPALMACSAGAELLVVLNASPYEIHKQREREHIVRDRVLDAGLPVVYGNLIGGQDELVFDGNSFVMDAKGEVVMRAPAFEEGIWLAEFTRDAQGKAVPKPATVAPELSDEESVYRALVLGVRDYVNKHGFPGVVMGLSGG